MDNNYQVIRLINGTTIVGDIITSSDEFIIQYPLEVHFKPVMNSEGKLTGEQMTLRPYLILTRETEICIDPYNVMTCNPLDARLNLSYEEMVSTAYKKNINFEGNFYKEDHSVNSSDDLSENELDYLKDLLDKLQSGDEVIH
jgi:hypothetical protein